MAECRDLYDREGKITERGLRVLFPPSEERRKECAIYVGSGVKSSAGSGYNTEFCLTIWVDNAILNELGMSVKGVCAYAGKAQKCR